MKFDNITRATCVLYIDLEEMLNVKCTTERLYMQIPQ